MRIIIVGAGAVGGLLGGMLARSGSEVAFVARGATKEHLRRRGLRITGPEGTFEVGPFDAEEDPVALAPGDAAFVTVKSWQVRALAPSLAPVLGPAAIIAPLENGVEAADALVSALGAAPVIGGVCHVLAWAEAPGQIAFQGAPLRVTLGELGGGTSPRVEALGAVLRDAGMSVGISDDIRVAVWAKLLFVGPMGMVGAATGMTVGPLRAHAESRRLLEDAMTEVRRVALARGVRVPEDAVTLALARVDSLPEGGATSMHRDILAGRPSELEEQVGAVVRLAASANVDVPVHRRLYAALEARERVARTSFG